LIKVNVQAILTPLLCRHINQLKKQTMKKVMITLSTIAIVIIVAAFKSANDSKSVTIINTVEVKDFAGFKKGFDNGAPIREKGGIKVVGMFQSVDNANIVTVVEEAASVEAAKAFFSDPKMKEAMEKTGVISKPEMKFLNKVQ
jgi:quinol monooxygenase YgiN